MGSALGFLPSVWISDRRRAALASFAFYGRSGGARASWMGGAERIPCNTGLESEGGWYSQAVEAGGRGCGGGKDAWIEGDRA